MGISPNNINKPTPKVPRIIGNSLALFVMGMQPILASAPDDIIGYKGKFWIGVGLASLGIAGKVFTMMFADDDINIQLDEQQS